MASTIVSVSATEVRVNWGGHEYTLDPSKIEYTYNEVSEVLELFNLANKRYKVLNDFRVNIRFDDDTDETVYTAEELVAKIEALITPAA